MCRQPDQLQRFIVLMIYGHDVETHTAIFIKSLIGLIILAAWHKYAMKPHNQNQIRSYANLSVHPYQLPHTTYSPTFNLSFYTLNLSFKPTMLGDQ